MKPSHVYRKPKAGPSAPVYQIEGESLTVAQVAERLGISAPAATRALSAARTQTGPVTWARLRAGEEAGGDTSKMARPGA